MNFQERSVTIVDLGSITEFRAENISTLVVRFSRGITFDFGALSYVRRAQARRGKQSLKVDVGSIDTRRLEPIRNIVEFFLCEHRDGGLRVTSLRTLATECFSFMYWCDNEGHVEWILSRENAIEALRAYFSHIEERYKRGEIVSRTAQSLQSSAARLIGYRFSDENIVQQFSLDMVYGRGNRPTEPPDERSYGRVLALCKSLFDGFCSVSSGGAVFPYRMAMPRYLPWKEHYIWLFPRKQWINPPYIETQSGWKPNENSSIDFCTGAVKSEASVPSRRVSDVVPKIEDISARIVEANGDRRHISRLRYARTAHNAFFQLFIAASGMNESNARTLLWNADFNVSTERQKFRTIKYRALGLNCRFQIEAKFMKVFERYLRLRDYMLDGNEFPYLFVSFGREEFEKPREVLEGLQVNLFKTLTSIDPSIEKIKARKMRAAKGNKVDTGNNEVIAAHILQNSVRTFRAHYRKGSRDTHYAEASNFYEALTSEAAIVVENSTSLTATPIANCLNYGDPSPINDTPPIEVNCSRTEGCLFCKSFRVHAGFEDAKKLLSFKYYAERLTVNVVSVEQFNATFAKIFERIDVIIHAIEEKVPDVRRIVEQEIENGELSSYWAAKVQMLIDNDFL